MLVMQDSLVDVEARCLEPARFFCLEPHTFPLSKLGRGWTLIGSEKPLTGTEVENTLLVSALLASSKKMRLDFINKEWQTMEKQIEDMDLGNGSYVKAGSDYWRPVRSGAFGSLNYDVERALKGAFKQKNPKIRHRHFLPRTWKSWKDAERESQVHTSYVCCVCVCVCV